MKYCVGIHQMTINSSLSFGIEELWGEGSMWNGYGGFVSAAETQKGWEPRRSEEGKVQSVCFSFPQAHISRGPKHQQKKSWKVRFRDKRDSFVRRERSSSKEIMGKELTAGKGPRLGQAFEETWKQVSVLSEKPNRDFNGRESL